MDGLNGFMRCKLLNKSQSIELVQRSDKVTCNHILAITASHIKDPVQAY